MFGTLNNYLNNISRLWHSCDGDSLSMLLSLKDKHIMNRNLCVENPENVVVRVLDSPLDEIVIAHLKALYYLSVDRKCIHFLLLSPVLF